MSDRWKIKPTVRWEDGAVVFLDQTKLPHEEVELHCKEVDQVAEAIEALRIRGAPAIGIVAAFGVALHVWQGEDSDAEKLLRRAEAAAHILQNTRPTARNLFWALERMLSVGRNSLELSDSEFKERLLVEAESILREDIQTGRAIGEFGKELLGGGSAVLTHCNAGGLATGGAGTALAPIFAAASEGKDIHVYVDETRPVLQGTRLTVYELMKANIKCTLISDGAAAYVLSQGKVDLAIVGADRIAANGDVANKIGTYSLALACNRHGAPFYVAAPMSTVDLSLPDGSHIPIEERNPEEVRGFCGHSVAPEGAEVYNPAFDITPHKLISAIITEKGVLRAPFGKSLMRA